MITLHVKFKNGSIKNISTPSTAQTNHFNLGLTIPEDSFVFAISFQGQKASFSQSDFKPIITDPEFNVINGIIPLSDIPQGDYYSTPRLFATNRISLFHYYSGQHFTMAYLNDFAKTVKVINPIIVEEIQAATTIQVRNALPAYIVENPNM